MGDFAGRAVQTWMGAACLAACLFPTAAAAASEVYRAPACGKDGSAISLERPQPVALRCEGSNRFAATYPGDVWTMVFDYDPCGGLTLAATSLIDDIAFPAGAREMTVIWRSQDSLAVVAAIGLAGTEIANQTGTTTVPEHSDFGILVTEIDFAAPDAQIRHLGRGSADSSVVDGLDREVLRNFLKTGFVECEIPR